MIDIDTNALFEVSPIYEANRAATEKVIVNQGGSWSGKTYSILQVLFVIGIEQPCSTITITAQDVPNLKRGAYKDAKSILQNSPQLQKWYRKINETDRIIYCKNRSKLEFVSFANSEQAAKGSKRDYLYINEADSFPYPIYFQLANRTNKQIFIDYNPSAKFWCHEKVIGRDNTRLIISDHRHNPFLSAEKHAEIESIEDKNYFDVYARGRTGKIQGLIFSNWKLFDRPISGFKYRWFGLDWGFSKDPTTLIEVILYQKQLYVTELIYEAGLTNTDLMRRIDAFGIPKDDMIIVADSEDPKSISEFKRCGYMIEPADKKGKSIKRGIEILQRYKININRNSTNIRDEFSKYRWKTDKLTGESSTEPLGGHDHAIDAIRYVALNKLALDKRGSKPTGGVSKV